MDMLTRFFNAVWLFLNPPTTPANATVVDKFFDHIPNTTKRNLDYELSFDSRLETIEVPVLKVTIPGTEGAPRIYVPSTLYHKVEVGEHVEVRVRPSRFFANTTRVSFAH